MGTESDLKLSDLQLLYTGYQYDYFYCVSLIGLKYVTK
jgi:hypothetical protein